MKTTGIVRKVDELGRVVLPIELRRTMKIDEKDPLEIYVDENKIILQKYTPGCRHCGDMKNLVSVFGENICVNCIDVMNQKAASMVKQGVRANG